MAKKVKNRELYEQELELLLAFPSLTRKQRGWSLKQYKARVKELQELIEASKLGSMKRRKGSTYERAIAKKIKEHTGIELTRTPQSGGFAKKSEKADDFRGDIVCLDKDVHLNVHIECKSHQKINLREWYRQASSDCPEDLKPLVIFHIYKSSIDLAFLKLEDFSYLIKQKRAKPILIKSKTTKTKIEWRTIEGFNDYMISNTGIVKSCKNNLTRILKAGVDSSGYKLVGLCKDGLQKSFRVHNLVAETFIEPSNGRLVNHIDGNKLNNKVSNLEYVSYSQNLDHAYKNKLRPSGEDIYCAKLSDLDVIKIRGELCLKASRNYLAKKYKVSNTTIQRIATNDDYRNTNKLKVFSKDHKTWKPKDWYRQAISDCPEGLSPIVIMHQAQENKEGKRVRDAEDFVMLKLEDFLKLTEGNLFRRE